MALPPETSAKALTRVCGRQRESQKRARDPSKPVNPAVIIPFLVIPRTTPVRIQLLLTGESVISLTVFCSLEVVSHPIQIQWLRPTLRARRFQKCLKFRPWLRFSYGALPQLREPVARPA